MKLKRKILVPYEVAKSQNEVIEKLGKIHTIVSKEQTNWYEFSFETLRNTAVAVAFIWASWLLVMQSISTIQVENTLIEKITAAALLLVMGGFLIITLIPLSQFIDKLWKTKNIANSKFKKLLILFVVGSLGFIFIFSVMYVTAVKENKATKSTREILLNQKKILETQKSEMNKVLEEIKALHIKVDKLNKNK